VVVKLVQRNVAGVPVELHKGGIYMEKIKIEKEVFILDKEEKTKLTQCLKYCLHRLMHHPGNGLGQSGVETRFVEYMIKNI